MCLKGAEGAVGLVGRGGYHLHCPPSLIYDLGYWVVVTRNYKLYSAVTLINEHVNNYCCYSSFRHQKVRKGTTLNHPYCPLFYTLDVMFSGSPGCNTMSSLQTGT